MSPAEILNRLREAADQTYLGIVHRFSRKIPFSRPWRIEDFAFCTAKAPVLPRLPAPVAPREQPSSLLKGRYPALGFDWQWTPQGSPWHRAPDTGREWPRNFYSRIPRRTRNFFGDIRVVWEPNRLQHLVYLGLFYKELRKEDPERADKAASLAVSMLASWQMQNPPLSGVNYISVMECGLRILAICQATDLLRDSAHMTEAIWKTLLDIIYSHAVIISRRISLHSSLGNHTIAECLGLLYAGLLFPEFPEAAKWTKKGLALMDSEADHQILSDGGGAEQTMWYLRFILDLYGTAINLLLAKQQAVPERMMAAWRRGTDFLSHFCSKAGNLADIGDRDDGWALVASEDIIGPSEFRRSRWEGVRTFTASGYSLIRSTKGLLTIMDHGPLGMPPAYGHGHADCLSVILNSGERPILIDPGTFAYNCEDIWRAYFRGTSAHNTVRVDGEDQARQETPFMWSGPYEATLLHREILDNGALIIAKHDGYKRLRNPVVHTRAVRSWDHGNLLVLDHLNGVGRHRLELNWHVAPDLEIAEGKESFQITGFGGKAVLRIQGGACRLARGEKVPILGWASPKYGVKIPTNVISCTIECALPHELITLIAFDNVVSIPDCGKEPERMRALML
jgi:hypothetical protein